MNEPENRATHQIVLLEPQHALARGADVFRGAVGVEHDHDFGRIFDDRPEPAFTLAQGVFNTLLLRHLTDDADNADATAVVIENRAVLSGDPAGSARRRN